LETKDAGEEAMERNNLASQNSQRVVELKEEEYSLLKWWQTFTRPHGITSQNIHGNILLFHLTGKI
jgi:hypothetical protein